MKHYTIKFCGLMLGLLMGSHLFAQNISINLNSPHQGIDGVGFCHEGDRQNGNYYVISTGIQQMLDNHMTLFRDMFPNKTFAPSKGNYNYTDARVVNSFNRLKYMQDHGIKTILGIWDVPNWMVSNPSAGSKRKINNFDDFADFITAFLVHGKNNYNLKVDFIDINETKTSGVNLDLTAQEYITLIQKCQTRFTSNGIQTRVNMGSVLLWDLQYDKDIYNAVKNLSVAGYPSWHSYRGGSLHGEQREPISYWQDWGAWQQTLDRNLWGTETDYDAYYWREMNPDVDTWTGAQEMAVMYYRNYYVARMSTSAGWFWHPEYPSNNVHIAYMNNFQPGGQVVEVSQPDATVMTVAYKHEANKKFVIQVLNESSSSKAVTFSGVPNNKPLTLIRTSEAGDRYKTIGTYTPNGTTFSITLQPNSFNTFYGELVATVDAQAPTTPANFAAAGVTSSTASLTWSSSTDNVDVAGYQIFNASGTLMGSASGTSTTLQNLTANTTYMLVVKAYDAAGNFSGASNTVTITTAPTPTGVATVYADCTYGGQATILQAGTYTLAQMQALGIINDNISSLQVQSGYMITLYADNNFSGASVTFTANDDCLVDNAFNDLASSLKVASVPSSIVIQAENYNNMSGVTKETCSDTGGGQNVGSLDTNDWLVYDNINIPVSGTYTVQYRVASLNGGAKFQLEKGGGSVIYGTVTIPQTSGWQTWTTIQQTITLTAGTQSFGIKALVSGANLNWWSLTPGTIAGARQAQPADEVKEEVQLSVYPSPAQDILNINTGIDTGISTIHVITLDGRVAYTTQINGAKGTIHVADINAKGVVLLRIINIHKTSTVKVILK
jgi:hypothetical protein